MAIREDLANLLGPKKSWSVTTSNPTKATTPTYEQVEPQLLETEGQKKAREYLTTALETGPTPYSGQLTADMPYRSQLESSLQSYANREMPSLYGEAQGVVSGTLTGQYDPSTSQYYQGLRQAQDINLADSLNRYGRQQYLTGNLRSTPTDYGQARLIAENTASLNQTLGQLALQERQNQLSAVNQAMQLGQLQDQFGANTLSALGTYGGQLQALDQAAADRAYQEFLRQQQAQTGLASTLLGSQATYAYPQFRQADTLGVIR